MTLTHDECLFECRRRMRLVLIAVKSGAQGEAVVQRIAMYSAMSARTAASRGAALALEFLEDQAARNHSTP